MLWEVGCTALPVSSSSAEHRGSLVGSVLKSEALVYLLWEGISLCRAVPGEFTQEPKVQTLTRTLF